MLKPSQAKEDLKLTFDALPQTERDKIFDIRIGKNPVKNINTDTTSEPVKLEQQPDELMKPSPQQLKQQIKQKSENVENDATVGDVQNLDWKYISNLLTLQIDSVTPKASRPKKVLDPEKAAKVR